METMFACIVRFSGSENSNMLMKILREQRELPQQPNLHTKTKNAQISVLYVI